MGKRSGYFHMVTARNRFPISSEFGSDFTSVARRVTVPLSMYRLARAFVGRITKVAWARPILRRTTLAQSLAILTGSRGWRQPHSFRSLSSFDCRLHPDSDVTPVTSQYARSIACRPSRFLADMEKELENERSQTYRWSGVLSTYRYQP